MAEADTNGDGSIDASEWNALFAKLDADNSGKIEDGEMARHHGSPPPEALAFMIAHHADTDRNGQVTSAEWKAHVAELDENDDGELSAGELRFRHRSEEAGASLPPFATAVGHRQRRQPRRGRARRPLRLARRGQGRRADLPAHAAHARRASPPLIAACTRRR